MSDVIVLGAGLSGLTAARDLRAAGADVVVLEKSRGVGGRAATRRWAGWPVDHGAQFFTARSEDFRTQVNTWLEQGTCFPWAHGFHQWHDGELESPPADGFPRYACSLGMTSLAKDLAGAAQDFIHLETKVTSITRHERAWRVTGENSTTHSAPALIVTNPPPQSAELLGPCASATATLLGHVVSTPCLALVARYPRRDIDWRGIQAPEHPVISWIGHDTSKRPTLHPDGTVLVIHASATFSGANYQADEKWLMTHLLSNASEMTGLDLSTPEAFFIQRWRYAHSNAPDRIHARILAADGPAKLIIAGEAMAGGKIE
ncbi:MAG: FAD-dependent oxidoreductase, partial [Chthoniobacterales bacterium]